MLQVNDRIGKIFASKVIVKGSVSQRTLEKLAKGLNKQLREKKHKSVKILSLTNDQRNANKSSIFYIVRN